MRRGAIWAAALAFAGVGTLTASAALGKLGAMGDSLTDEYWDSGVASYATNWPDQVVLFRGIDMGPTAAQAGVGTWGSPRNAGYEYNWALSGATSATLVSEGQDTGLAGQVASNGVSNAVLAIGPNDFNPESSSAYSSIYFGLWSTSQIQAYVTQTLSNIETALATVRAAGASVAVANVIDPGPTPAVVSSGFYSSATDRNRVTAAVQSVNSGIKNLAQKYQVPMMDWYGLETAILGPNTNLHSTIEIGNVTINLRGSDPGPPNSTPTDAFVSDGFHPNTVFQGVLANLILQAFDSGYGWGVKVFSDQEILSHASIPYGGAETLQALIGAYSNYIVLPVLPRFKSVHPTGTNLSLAFTTVSNQLYIIESCNNLAAASWATVTNDIDGTGQTVTLTLAGQFSPNIPQRFYRVRQLP